LSSPCALCGESRSEPICRLSDRLYRTTGETFALVSCRGCGLARLDPPPANPSLHYPAGYWHEPAALETIYRRLVLRDHVGFVRRALGSGRRVLDVGCGSGFFLSELRPAYAVGLDASTRAAALAWRRHRIPSLAADLARAPFSDGSFDLITMFHVLEHLSDPPAYVRAARRLLASGGKLVVQTPNFDSWQCRVCGPRWIGLDAPRHLFDFRLADLRRLLEAGGFRILRVKHFSWRDNAACLATSLAPGLEPVARSARGLPSRNFSYLALTLCALPFAAMEALFGHGATVMIEAEPA
jgi:SAM-dependent methyltransferase